MYKAREFKSIHIDLDKKEFFVNGEVMNPLTSKLELEFENGEWLLSIVSEERFEKRQGRSDWIIKREPYQRHRTLVKRRNRP